MAVPWTLVTRLREGDRSRDHTAAAAAAAMDPEGRRVIEEMEEAAESGDSGNVSQSLSYVSAMGDATEEPPGAGSGSACTRSTALLTEAVAEEMAYVLLPGCGSLEMQAMERSLEDLLTRVDEFVGMLDMIRSDSSQIVNESVPHIHTKAAEMRRIYRKIDTLETFVKTLGRNVAVMEEHVTKAETNLGAFPNPFKKFLRTISAPSFLAKSTAGRHSTPYEPPPIFKTEDYFSNCSDQALT